MLLNDHHKVKNIEEALSKASWFYRDVIKKGGVDSSVCAVINGRLFEFPKPSEIQNVLKNTRKLDLFNVDNYEIEMKMLECISKELMKAYRFQDRNYSKLERFRKNYDKRYAEENGCLYFYFKDKPTTVYYEENEIVEERKIVRNKKFITNSNFGGFLGLN